MKEPHQYITIPLTLPLTVDTGKFFLGLAALAIVLLAVIFAPQAWQKLKAWVAKRRFSERPSVNAALWYGVFLAIPGLWLFWISGASLFQLWWQGPPQPAAGAALSTSGDAIRNYYLALVGLMTAIGVLAAAPFALIKILATERQTTAQEEGLITDRINKAVAALGAEKTVEQIGRPVVILTGEPTEVDYHRPIIEKFELPDRSVLTNKRYNVYSTDEDGEEYEAHVYEVRTWPKNRTVIEWRGEALDLGETESIESEGAWQVFKQTLPNLEVRVGAIYALERIAQDSLRDHIQIMEILCAYIRQNAPASSAPKLPEPPEPPEWFEGEKDGATWTGKFDALRAAHRKALEGIKPRLDIQTALTVIGRRSDEQKRKEWGEWQPFVEVVPDWPAWSAKEDGTASEAYETGVKAWRTAFDNWQNLDPIYRLDLRETNLIGADLSGSSQQADFSLARFERANAQGADFSFANAQGAVFSFANAQGADFSEANAQGADFFGANAQGANFSAVNAQGADFTLAEFLSAKVKNFDYTGIAVSQDQVNAAFGDASTILPAGLTRPAHWPAWDTDWFSCLDEWKKWQVDKANYVPPPPPLDDASDDQAAET